MEIVDTEPLQAASYENSELEPGSRSFPDRRFPKKANDMRLRQSLFVIADLCGISSGALLALSLRFPDATRTQAVSLPSFSKVAVAEHVGIVVLYAVLIVLFCHTQALYSAYQASSRTRELMAVIKSILLATAVLTGCLFVIGVKNTSRVIIASTAVSALVTMVAWRQIRRRSLLRAVADGISCHNVLIVGTNSLSLAVAQHLALHRQLGFVVLGHVRSGTLPEDQQAQDLKIVGELQELKTLCRTHFIDEILVCSHDRQTVMQVISDARECSAGVRVIPDLYDGMALGARLDYLGDFPSLAVVHRSTSAFAMGLKRSMDVVLSAAGLTVLSPLLLLLAIVVKLDTRGPIFYASKRVGKKGRVFSCFKFRTMVADAETLKKKLEHLNERDGILFKITNDPRITRSGLFLRKHSLDELAQLFNVLRGDMSLVGPRPPLVTEVKQYQLEYLRRLEVAPGITGLWQVEARNNPSFDRYISLDLTYVENWSLFLDLQILFRTIAVVCAGTGS